MLSEMVQCRTTNHVLDSLYIIDKLLNSGQEGWPLWFGTSTRHEQYAIEIVILSNTLVKAVVGTKHIFHFYIGVFKVKVFVSKYQAMSKHLHDITHFTCITVSRVIFIFIYFTIIIFVFIVLCRLMLFDVVHNLPSRIGRFLINKYTWVVDAVIYILVILRRLLWPWQPHGRW